MEEVRAITVHSQPNIDAPGFVVTWTGLVVNGQPSFAEWAHLGQQLAVVERATHWAIGDWLIYGEGAFCEMYAQALEETRFAYDTLAHDKWLAGKIEFWRRRQNLSWSHHREVGALEPDEQDYWLDLAEQNDWTRQELRAAVKGKPHVAQNSGNNEWYTPAEYIEAARCVMGDIDLDPASSEIANETVQAAQFFTEEHDGLQHDWHGRVWMNPPYATPLIGAFTSKLAYHVKQDDVSEACVLVNNATETGWFNTLLDVASCVCLIRGRVRFIDQEGNPSGAPLQGQALLYIGPKVTEFGRTFSEFGTVLYAGRDQEQGQSQAA